MASSNSNADQPNNCFYLICNHEAHRLSFDHVNEFYIFIPLSLALRYDHNLSRDQVRLEWQNDDKIVARTKCAIGQFWSLFKQLPALEVPYWSSADTWLEEVAYVEFESGSEPIGLRVGVRRRNTDRIKNSDEPLDVTLEPDAPRGVVVGTLASKRFKPRTNGGIARSAVGKALKALWVKAVKKA